MKKPDILQMGPYSDEEQALLDSSFTLHPVYAVSDKQVYLRERAHRIRGIATRGEIGASGELIRSLPNLEIIAIYGVGYDAVDLDSAREANVAVSNTPDVLTSDVADLGMALMLCAARGVSAANDWVREGHWIRQGAFPLQSQVTGKRAGILGLGRIGRSIARRCEAFSMDIFYCDIQACEASADWTHCDNPEQLAASCDFLFVCSTGGDANRHLVNAQVIQALGPQGTLINVSRSSNVDEDALLTALEEKSLGFAALDVFDAEPNINPRFLALNNILLQPHHSSGTVETRAEMARLLYENLDAHFSGRRLITPVLERNKT